MVKPDTGQANFEENMTRRGSSPSPGGRRIRRSQCRPPSLQRGSRNFRRAGSPYRAARRGGRRRLRYRVSASCREQARRRFHRTSPSIFQALGSPRFMKSAISLRYSPLRSADDRGDQIEPRALQAAPARDRPSGKSSGSRSAGRWRANRECRRAPTAGACIVDFGDRADGGARIFRCGLLLDRDRRRKSPSIWSTSGLFASSRETGAA